MFGIQRAGQLPRPGVSVTQFRAGHSGHTVDCWGHQVISFCVTFPAGWSGEAEYKVVPAAANISKCGQ